MTQPSTATTDNKHRRRRTIKTRIIVGFCLFAFLTAALFSLYNFVFAYTVEDRFFERLINDEAAYLQANTIDGQLPAPRQGFFTIHQDTSSMPAIVRETLEDSPQQHEFGSGDGLHYHLYHSTQPQFYLLAEVSEFLVVRPWRTGLLIFLSMSALVMLLLAGGFGYWVANRTARPLTTLAALIEHTDPADLPKGFARQYKDHEVHILATAIEQAMLRIEAFITREQHFTRDASHELRTPISVIKNALELIEKETPQATDKLARIRGAALNMEQTVSTLLALAREDAGQSAPSAVALLPVIEQQVLDHAYLIGDKAVSVDVDVAASETAHLPAGVLEILLANLLSNAFHFTQAGHVRIHFSGRNLCVSDTGAGLTDEMQQQATQALKKGNDSIGYGLGLSIVQRLCERYGLTFKLESSEAGAKACIEFPPNQ